jgi:hypothetical protein
LDFVSIGAPENSHIIRQHFLVARRQETISMCEMRSIVVTVCHDTSRELSENFFQMVMETREATRRGAYSFVRRQQCMKMKNVKDMFVCSRCKHTHYCSKACQVLNWKNQHKKECITKKK